MKTLNVMDVKEDDVLSRNEMKAIMAGSGSSTNCVQCADGRGGGDDGYYCKEYDGSDPPSGCSWGTCSSC